MLVSEGCVAGIEIGARGSRVALADLEGGILAECASDGPSTSPAAALATIQEMLEACLSQARQRADRILRVGCAFGGPVDVGTGIILVSRRLPGWEGVPLASLLEERFNAQTLLDNDARLAALGEARFGAGRGEQNLAYIHLGTGVGGGLVIGGRVYHGATTTAGEFGHILMTEDGPICSCGKPGHLEAYTSGTAIVQRALALSVQQPGGLLPSANEVTPAQVFQAARDGDEAAQQVVSEALRYLGYALANLVTMVNPGVIVVGGSVAEAGPLLFQPLESLVRRFAMAVPGRAVRIVPSALKRDAILIGAVALALDSLAISMSSTP